MMFLSAVLTHLVIGISHGAVPNLANNFGDFVDLSHSLSENIPIWPGHLKFNMTFIEIPGIGNDICQSEYLIMSTHFGTHIDAPRHFHSKRWSVDQIPKKDLYGPGVVVNVIKQAKKVPNYQITKADIVAFEAENGRIPVGGIVLFNTGWGRLWNKPAEYLGTVTKNTSLLRNPGLSKEAAEFLVNERDIVGIGVDMISYDPADTKDYIAHVTLHEANKWALEAVANLDKLPPSGFTVYVFPLKLVGASGGPSRVIAFI